MCGTASGGSSLTHESNQRQKQAKSGLFLAIFFRNREQLETDRASNKKIVDLTQF
jgi:hypothetical protein